MRSTSHKLQTLLKLKTLRSFLAHLRTTLGDISQVFLRELYRTTRDKGVIVFLFLLPLGYPLLYSYIYDKEAVHDVPIVVVDQDQSFRSRSYIRFVDATSEIAVRGHAASLAEAQEAVQHRDAYGILVVPRDFSSRIASLQQARIAIYADMSGMLYYKALLTAATNASLLANADIKVMLNGSPTAMEDATTQQPIQYESVNLFNPAAGFASFLLPAVLILILQQVLLLSVGLAAGTSRERGSASELALIKAHRFGLLHIVCGKTLLYFVIALIASVWVAGCVPRLFGFPQLVEPLSFFLFLTPYLLASIFLAMTLSVFFHERENVILGVVFTSLLLLFISGISWPTSAIPPFWKSVSYLFPSTFAINGFVKLNNMGASFPDVRHEWTMLCAQCLVYGTTAVITYGIKIRRTLKIQKKQSADALRHPDAPQPMAE